MGVNSPKTLMFPPCCYTFALLFAELRFPCPSCHVLTRIKTPFPISNRIWSFIATRSLLAWISAGQRVGLGRSLITRIRHHRWSVTFVSPPPVLGYLRVVVSCVGAHT